MASEDQDVTEAATGRPAWHSLALFQAALLLILIALGLRFTPPAPPPLSERLTALQSDAASAAISAAITDADTGRALAEEDEARTTRFLTLQAQAAGLQLRELTFRPGVSADGVRPVDVRIELAGDPYHLPIFLDGLRRQRAINHPLSVRGEGAGQRADFTVLLRYYRPAKQPLDWVATQLSEQAPDAVEQAPLLEQAGRLAEWQHFRAQERALVSKAALARLDVARALPAALIVMRAEGKPLAWHEATEPEK